MSCGETGEAGSVEISTLQRKEIGELLHKLFLFHIDRYRLPNALRYLKEVSER
jgi:hypothetical protein